MNLADKTVLVTGSSRGIGRSIAQACATHGARVAVHYQSDRDAAEFVRASLPGGPHCVIQADVSDESSARALVESAVRDLGRLDVLVNNAGVFQPHPLPATPYEEWVDAWRQVISTNLLGAANVSYWAVEWMAKHGGGRIINMSSRGAFRGEPDSPAYGASKAGMNAMSQSMAKALAAHKILVFAVAPGFVETERISRKTANTVGDEIRSQSPFHRMARPEEVAQLVVFLAGEAPEFMSGAIIDINGASYLRT